MLSDNQLPYFVSGQECRSSRTMPVIDPYTNRSLYSACLSGPPDIDRAVSGAKNSQGLLKSMPLHQRSSLLTSAAAYLQKNAAAVIQTIVQEASKPLRFAKAEFDRCLDNLVLCSEQMKHLSGELINMDASPAGVNRKGYWFREPVGTVLAITPFNFPLNLVAHKVAPAIAAGCPVIIKPASKTPGAAIWLTRAFLEAGLPPEAISCLIGSGHELAQALVKHPDIAKITFTGSYDVGREIAAQAGIKKTTFELGSNSAAIVDSDLIDLEYAVKRLCLGAFYYQGQVCISVQRIFVLEPVFQRFVDAFVEQVKSLKLGDPQSADTDIGPMITPSEAKRVKSWIDQSVTNGARLLIGGKLDGNFLSPAVLTSVPKDDLLMTQEAFGPVVVIEAANSLDEAIDRTNESRFGLQASIFSRYIDHIESAISRLDVGGVIVNDFPSYRLDHMPYGGVKDSGIGREGARFAIEEMTRIKMVVINNETIKV